MKRDELERYMMDHRDEFELPGPGDELWRGIQDRIRPVRRIGWQRVWWQSAAAAAVFLLSWLIHDAVNRTGDTADTGLAAQTELNIDQRVQELLEADAYYASRIAETRDQVYLLSGKDDDLMKMLDLDLQELEAVFMELKNDLKDDTGNQEVIEAMIQNYRLKLEILEEMLQQMKRSNEPAENPQRYEL